MSASDRDQFDALLMEADKSILDLLALSPSERQLIYKEANNLLDEWFTPRRMRDWRKAQASGKSLAALFAVLTYCIDRMTIEDDPRCPT